MSQQSNSKPRFNIYKLVHLLEKLNYIWWCFISSIVFLLTNLPFLLLLFIYDLRVTTLPIFLLGALTIGPTFLALLITLRQVKVSEKIVRPYFRILRKKFKQALMPWLLFLPVFGLASVNVMLSNAYEITGVVKWLNLFIIVILVTFILNFYLLQAFFDDVSAGHTFILTLKLSVLKSARYSLSFLISLGVFVLLSNIQIYLFLFGISVIALLLVMNYEQVARYIEEETAYEMSDIQE